MTCNYNVISKWWSSLICHLLYVDFLWLPLPYLSPLPPDDSIIMEQNYGTFSMTAILVVLSIHGMALTLSLKALRTSIIISSAWRMKIQRYPL